MADMSDNEYFNMFRAFLTEWIPKDAHDLNNTSPWPHVNAARAIKEEILVFEGLAKDRDSASRGKTLIDSIKKAQAKVFAYEIILFTISKLEQIAATYRAPLTRIESMQISAGFPPPARDYRPSPYIKTELRLFQLNKFISIYKSRNPAPAGYGDIQSKLADDLRLLGLIRGRIILAGNGGGLPPPTFNVVLPYPTREKPPKPAPAPKPARPKPPRTRGR